MAIVNTTLEQVKDLQFAFKGSKAVIPIACRIVQTAIKNGGVWPDEIATDDIAVSDKNCIGSAYRWMKNIGILVRITSTARPSLAKKANGRTIFYHTLTSRALAETFLRIHNQTPVAGQIEMSL